MQSSAHNLHPSLAARMVNPIGSLTQLTFFPGKIRVAIQAITTVAEMKAQTDLWVERLSRTGTITAFHKAGKIRIVKAFVNQLPKVEQTRKIHEAKDANLLYFVGRVAARVSRVPRKIKGAIALRT
jgi:hypothetical protein